MHYTSATVRAADYLLRKHDPTYGVLAPEALEKLVDTRDREYKGPVTPEEHDRIYELLHTTNLSTYQLTKVVNRSQMTCWQIKTKRHKLYDPVRSERFRVSKAA
jgi:hypothetical protein